MRAGKARRAGHGGRGAARRRRRTTRASSGRRSGRRPVTARRRSDERPSERRCWRSATSTSGSARCVPSTGCRSTCPRAVRARAGRRERFGQDDDRAARSCASSPADGGRRVRRDATCSTAARDRRCGRSGGRCRSSSRTRTAASTRACASAGAVERGSAGAPDGRAGPESRSGSERCSARSELEPRSRRPVPAPALRRAAAARRDRARARRRAARAGARRADERARRHGAGPDPRSHRAPARRARARVPADLAQPRRRRAPVRGDGRAVPRARRGARTDPARCSHGPHTRTRWRSARRCPEIDLASRRSRLILTGGVPDPAQPPSGCAFHPRCPFVDERGRTEVPASRKVAPGRLAACHRAEELLAGMGVPTA